ncbi:minor tail protein [Gordonia phage Culver]|nr:minor tail protein [Gordonia phage Culver]
MDPVTLGMAKADAKKKYAPVQAGMKSLVPIADRIRPPFNSTGNIPSAILSNGTNRGGTSRERVTIQTTATGIVVDLTGWTTAARPIDGLNPVKYRVSLQSQVSTQCIPFTFGGQTSVVVDPKAAKVRSDPLGVTLVKGEVVYIRVHVEVAAGEKYPLLRHGRSNPYNEGLNFDPSTAGPGADETADGTTFNTLAGAGTSGLRLPGVSMLLGTPVKPGASLLVPGDSIPSGTGENYCYNQAPSVSEWLDFGWVNRACNNRWARTVLGISGTALGVWNTRVYAWRLKAIAEDLYFTHVLCELGINDLNSSTVTLESAKQNHIAAWVDLARYGKPVYQCTLTPFTTSTDNWTSTAGQASALPAGKEAIRVAVNDWIRDGSPIVAATMIGAATGASGAGIIRAGQSGHPLAAGDQFGKGYVEVADALETSRNSGIIKVPSYVRKVNDAVITSGALATLTSASAGFTSSDVGLYVHVIGAGVAGATHYGYITAVNSATSVTLHIPAVTPVSGAAAGIGSRALVPDGIHPTGDYGSNKGGQQVIADAVRPQLATILGEEAA